MNTKKDTRKLDECVYLTIDALAEKSGISKWFIRKLITTGQFTDYLKPTNKYLIHVPTFWDFMQKNYRGG